MFLSASTPVAAKAHRCSECYQPSAVGFEIQPDFVAAARARLASRLPLIATETSP